MTDRNLDNFCTTIYLLHGSIVDDFSKCCELADMYIVVMETLCSPY